MRLWLWDNLDEEMAISFKDSNRTKPNHDAKPNHDGESHSCSCGKGHGSK